MNQAPQIKFKTPEEKTIDFYKTVQAGDIALFEIFQEAVAVFGFTKVGKTSSCHILSGSTLKAEMVNGQLLYKPSTQKFSNARVGMTNQSETEIPNIFEAMVKDKGSNKFKKIALLDQPGYNDGFGFHRIFSNGYFHYRTFSKTPKLKFVLAFNKNDLSGTAVNFKRTISLFISSFTNYDAIKDQILAATSFLITKAEPNTKIEDLRAILTNLRDNAVGGMGAKQKEKYQTMISDMLNKNKLYFIQKPASVNQQTTDSAILQSINDNSTYWVRSVSENNIADMSQINFAVAGQILHQLSGYKDNEVFKEDFQNFIEYTQNRITEAVLTGQGSLVKMVKLLIQDAVSDNESHRFLDAMVQFNTKFYKFYDQYRDKRQKTQTILFKSTQAEGNVTNEQLQKQSRSIYFIKKFKVLDFLKTRDEIFYEEDNQQLGRSIEWLERFSNIFIVLFRKFSILRVNPKDNENIIYKYNYIIQRLIEQSKILTLILFKDRSVEEKFMNLGLKTIEEDIFFMLRDKFFIALVGEINTIELKLEFLQNFDFQQLKVVNDEVIDFLESIETHREDIQFKIAKLIVQYSEIIFKNNRNPKEEEKKEVAKRLYKCRNKFYSYLTNLKKEEGASKKSKEACTELILMLTNRLGVILLSFSMYEDAREVYRSVSNADMVFHIYTTELAQLAADQKAARKLLMEWGKSALYYQRKQLALKCYQQAYSKSTCFSEMKLASEAIVSVCTLKPQQSAKSEEYLKKLFNEQFCEQFSSTLHDHIRILCEYYDD